MTIDHCPVRVRRVPDMAAWMSALTALLVMLAGPALAKEDPKTPVDPKSQESPKAVVYTSTEDDLKADAVRRLADAHDPAIFVATGALFLKQEAIRAAGGKPLDAATRAAVDSLIETSVADARWFHMGWRVIVDRYFSAEETDEIASHFATQGGALQRRVIELALGEVLLSTYTFTDRIDYRMAESEGELKTMQRVVNDRQFQGIQDFSIYPDAVKFASGGTGVKYMKMVMIQGIETITTHFDAVARQIRAVVAGAK